MLKVEGINLNIVNIEYLNKINIELEKKFKVKVGKSKIINALIEMFKSQNDNILEIEQSIKKYIFKKSIIKKYKTLGKIQSEIKNLENEIK